MRPPRAILFDLGDTILRQHWFDLSVGIDAVVNDRTLSDELASAFRAYELPAYERGDECLLAEWLRMQVPSLAKLTRDAIENRIWAAVVRMEPLPGIEEVLKRVVEDRVPIGAVSNAAFSGRALRAELARHGLDARFRFVLSSADLRVRKPSPGIYAAALEQLGARAQDTWFVGDTFNEDIVGAIAVGLPPVWLAGDRELPRTAPNVLVVRDWVEFLRSYSSCRGGAQ